MSRTTIIVVAEDPSAAETKFFHEIKRLEAARRRVVITQCEPGFIEVLQTLPIYLLGVPDDINPRDLQLDTSWRLSSRSARAFRLTRERAIVARRKAETLSDDELRARISDDNQAILRFVEEMGIAASGVDTPDPAGLSRQEMVQMLAEECAGPQPDFELIYPGAEDPTVLTIAQASALPEIELRERVADVIAALIDQFGVGGLTDDFPVEVDNVSHDALLGLIAKWAYFFDPAGDHPVPVADHPSM